MSNQDYMIRQVRGWLKESPVDEIKKFLDTPKEDLVIYHSDRDWETQSHVC